MQRVFVLDKNKKALAPCHPARARELLTKKKAAVFRRYPFTIILKERNGGDVQPIELKFDPGSKTTGIAVVAQFQRGLMVVWAAELEHRGQRIKSLLDSRRMVRRNRRNRKTRYRKPRFLNRTKPQGWLAPSLMSRVYNCQTWARRIIKFAPVSEIAVETVRFDTQKMQNPEISGVEYQQGTLAGYELREYLLEKWHRKCAYCGAENVPLEIEHIHPKAKGGTNRVSNLAMACGDCNDNKGTDDVRVFLKDKPDVLKRILAQSKAPLKDAAAVNATRYAIGRAMKSFGLPVSFWSGGRTKFNRCSQNLPKTHWLDAACVGETGCYVQIQTGLTALSIKATGHGSRQMCSMNKYGFPRTGPKQAKKVHGFKTGDIVKAIVPKGKYAGTHTGKVAVRCIGAFRVGEVDGINWKYCSLIHSTDGYAYTQQKGERPSSVG